MKMKKRSEVLRRMMMMMMSRSQVKEDGGREEEALIRSLMTGHTPTNYRVKGQNFNHFITLPLFLAV